MMTPSLVRSAFWTLVGIVCAVFCLIHGGTMGGVLAGLWIAIVVGEELPLLLRAVLARLRARRDA